MAMHRHDVHVDPVEAQEVVRLAAERQSASVDNGPTVNGLAEALGLPREEVERLLAEVRAQRGVVAPRRRIFGDRSAALSAAIALVIFVATAGGLFLYRAQAAPPPLELLAASQLPPGTGPDMVPPPPTFEPSAPAVIVPGFDAELTEREFKQQEIKRLMDEIAEIHARRANEDAARSVEDLDRKIKELRAELEKLRKE